MMQYEEDTLFDFSAYDFQNIQNI